MLANTIAAAFISFTVLAGAASAETAHTSPADNSDLLTHLYEEMDRSRFALENIVLASAETRIADAIPAVNRLPAHRPLLSTFVIAHLAE